MNELNTSSPFRRIAITMGDPAGVGPELCLKYLDQRAASENEALFIFGDAQLLQKVADHLGWKSKTPVLSWDEFLQREDEIPEAWIVDLPGLEMGAVQPGTLEAENGKASYRYIEMAIEQALAGKIDAVVTNPIHKEALHLAGIPFPGHTEILASKTASDSICMMLTAPQITCSLVTAHVGYDEVPGLLSTERILEAIELTHQAMHSIRERLPQLTVCGLNPHAGEHGLFGHEEEERIIVPAVEEAKKRGMKIVGPLPADTAFVPQIRKKTDAYICMYHDQGLIPLKAIAFDEAVNITLGLPIIRTSVDHGTAFDIAWQGKANVNSLIQAINLARQLIEK